MPFNGVLFIFLSFTEFIFFLLLFLLPLHKKSFFFFCVFCQQFSSVSVEFKLNILSSFRIYAFVIRVIVVLTVSTFFPYSSSPLDFFFLARYQLIDCDEKISFFFIFYFLFFSLKKKGQNYLRWTLLRACLLTSKCSISQPTVNVDENDDSD